MTPTVEQLVRYSRRIVALASVVYIIFVTDVYAARTYALGSIVSGCPTALSVVQSPSGITMALCASPYVMSLNFSTRSVSPITTLKFPGSAMPNQLAVADDGTLIAGDASST